jgi:hypothetical protein
MTRLQQLRESRPELLSDEQTVTLAEQADNLHDIKGLADTDGGKRLVEILMTDAVSSFYRACSSYRTATHLELIALLADVSSKLDTAKLLINSKEGMEYLDAELNRALRE